MSDGYIVNGHRFGRGTPKWVTSGEVDYVCTYHCSYCDRPLGDDLEQCPECGSGASWQSYVWPGCLDIGDEKCENYH